MTALPKFTMRELLDAGVHFGHKTLRWNPKMAPFIFGVRNDIHIIDLQQTVPMLYKALKAIHDVAASNGRILFVGTKSQASDIIAEEAQRCGQYFINHRWLGGMLTNWQTVSRSIKTLKQYEIELADENSALTKKEKLKIAREKEKLEKSLGGIKNMGNIPDILFIIDTNKEDIAVKEASKLGIPIVAIVDSNSDPVGITHPIPGNDDATRAIKLYCSLVSDAVLKGTQVALASSGVDIGASAEISGEGINPANTNVVELEKEGKQEAKGKPANKKKFGKSDDKEGDDERSHKRGKSKAKTEPKKAPEVVKKKTVTKGK